jgi:hypothetical protein
VTRFSQRQNKQRLDAERRRTVVVKLLTDGIPQANIAQALGVSRMTISRDKALLMQQSRDANRSQFEVWRDEHIEELEQLRGQLEDKKILPARKIELMLAIIQADSRIKGTAAPERSITATVNADVDPATLPEYRRWLFETRYMSKDGHEKVYAYIRAERLNVREAVAVEVPTSSPLWNDAPKQLEEGEK